MLTLENIKPSVRYMRGISEETKPEVELDKAKLLRALGEDHRTIPELARISGLDKARVDYVIRKMVKSRDVYTYKDPEAERKNLFCREEPNVQDRYFDAVKAGYHRTKEIARFLGVSDARVRNQIDKRVISGKITKERITLKGGGHYNYYDIA